MSEHSCRNPDRIQQRGWGSSTSPAASEIYSAHTILTSVRRVITATCSLIPDQFTSTLHWAPARPGAERSLSFPKMWAGGRSFRFMETVCLAMLWNYKHSSFHFSKWEAKPIYLAVSWTCPTHTHIRLTRVMIIYVYVGARVCRHSAINTHDV